jgi:hypothetical protein
MSARFRRRDSEQGVAMIVAILVVLVATALVTTMMYTSFHNTTTTARNRSWGQAVHVAESGIHQAIAQLQSTSGVAPTGTVSGVTADGSYQYRVTALSRNRYQIDAVGSVGTDPTLASSRRLRVLMAPPKSFEYALFSLSDVTTKNNNLVCGDIWANTYVTVYQNDSVVAADDEDCPDGAGGTGSVTAATGHISLEHNSRVDGDAWSGGYNSSGRGISLAGGASIGGFAKASSASPGCSDDPTNLDYDVVNGGTISGQVVAWGTITGSGISGSQSPLTCTVAAATKTMPAFSYNPANYPAGTVHEYDFPADYATFNAYVAAHKTNLNGVFYIDGGSSATPVDLGGVSVDGDLTVIATGAPIDASGGIGESEGNTDDKLVVLASFYTAPATNCSTNGGNPGDCAIGIKNNFSVGDGDVADGGNTAVLLYAPNGPVSFKNNANFLGAVYANNIQVKNNMNVVYDPRVSQIVGFGTITLDIELWLECGPGAVADTDC